jgi:hypothetical protein
MKNKTKILYYFESDTHILVEIKFDIKKELDKSKLYYWILYDKNKEEFKKLDFVSMSEYERIFEQGKFNFNSNTGFLLMNNIELIFNRKTINSDTNYKLINIISNDLLKNIN